MKVDFRPRLQGVKLRQRVDWYSPEKEHGGRGTGALWEKRTESNSNF